MSTPHHACLPELLENEEHCMHTANIAETMKQSHFSEIVSLLG
jgi:hypothetical protein